MHFMSFYNDALTGGEKVSEPSAKLKSLRSQHEILSGRLLGEMPSGQATNEDSFGKWISSTSDNKGTDKDLDEKEKIKLDNENESRKDNWDKSRKDSNQASELTKLEQASGIIKEWLSNDSQTLTDEQIKDKQRSRLIGDDPAADKRE